jgi:hypothetical protein
LPSRLLASGPRRTTRAHVIELKSIYRHRQQAEENGVSGIHGHGSRRSTSCATLALSGSYKIDPSSLVRVPVFNTRICGAAETLVSNNLSARNPLIAIERLPQYYLN